MMPNHITQAKAFDALCDPDIPVPDALKMFERAYRRSNKATKAFVLMVTGSLREYAEGKRT